MRTGRVTVKLVLQMRSMKTFTLDNIGKSHQLFVKVKRLVEMIHAPVAADSNLKSAVAGLLLHPLCTKRPPMKFGHWIFQSWLLSILLISNQAQALTTREKFEKWCTGTSTVAGAGRCLGYLLAAEDALAHDSIEGIRACLPKDISLQEQNRIVLEWLAANPNAEAKTAMGLVARAYAASYPCK